MASIELLLHYCKKNQNYCKWNESNVLVFGIVSIDLSTNLPIPHSYYVTITIV